jgi:hypothetical protein
VSDVLLRGWLLVFVERRTLEIFFSLKLSLKCMAPGPGHKMKFVRIFECTQKKFALRPCEWLAGSWCTSRSMGLGFEHSLIWF